MIKRNIIELSLILFITFLVLAFIYPDLFLKSKIRYNSGHDITIPFQAFLYNFYFLENFYFSNWNFYDQTNHTFFHFNQGLYTFPAILESGFTKILSLFMHVTSDFAQKVHTYIFNFICFFFISLGSIKIFNHYGIYIFGRILIISFSNILLAVPIISGLMTSFIYSLTPLLIYFIIKLIEEKNIKYLLFFFFLYSFAFAQIPLFAVGYFFVQFHFIFILLFIILIFSFFFYKEQYQKIKYSLSKIEFPKSYFLFSIFIMLIFYFNLEIFLTLLETNTLSQSGLTGGDRFERFLNPIAYFKSYVPTLDIVAILRSFFIFDKNLWYILPTFLGSTIVIVSLVGLLYEKKNRFTVYLFLLSIIYVIFLQGPRDIIFNHPSTYAHLFNSVLNPFSFLLQHAHMSLLNIYFFMLPIFACGIKNLRELTHKKLTYKLKLFLGIIFINILSIYILNIGKNAYLLMFINSLIILIFVYLPSASSWSKYFFISAICFCLFLDLYAMKLYIKNVPYNGERIHLRQILDNKDNIKNTQILDLQSIPYNNFPFKLLLNKPKVKFYENREKKILEDSYFLDQTYKGFFYKNIFLERVLKQPYIYEIRHKVYSEIYNDKYISNLNEILHIELFNGHYNSDEMSYQDFLEKKLYKNSIFLETKNKKKITENFDKIENIKTYKKKINLKDIKFFQKKNDYNIFVFNSADIIPSYLSTSFVNADDIKLIVNQLKMTPVQNNIFDVYQFDINNYKTDNVYFSIPENIKASDIELIYKRPYYLESFKVKKNNFVFNINLNNERYILLRFPFDPNWKILINDKPVKYFKANKYWIGIPVYETGTINLKLSYVIDSLMINNFGVILYYLCQIFLLSFILRVKY